MKQSALGLAGNTEVPSVAGSGGVRPPPHSRAMMSVGPPSVTLVKPRFTRSLTADAGSQSTVPRAPSASEKPRRSELRVRIWPEK